MKNTAGFTPARVKCISDDLKDFTKDKAYNAYFLEYWQGKRNSLHVENDDGDIVDFIPFEDFVVLEDKENVLNTYEATVQCITHEYDSKLFDLNYGKEYKAIGRDKNGMYLVMDESYDCYFYPASDFKVMSDPHHILTHTSVYYSYWS